MRFDPAREIVELNWFDTGLTASLIVDPLRVAVSLAMSASPSHETRPTFAATVPVAGVWKLSSGIVTEGREAATREVSPS